MLGRLRSAIANPGFSSLWPMFATVFVLEVGLGVVAPVLPEMMRGFSLTASQISLMATMFGLARLLTDLLVGLIPQRVSRARLLVAGLVLVSVGSVGCLAAPSYALVLLARAVMGVGSALCLVTLLIAVSVGSPEGSKGSAIGMYQASILAGIAMGPALGGLFASLWGWRMAFLSTAVSAGFAMLLAIPQVRYGVLTTGALTEAKPGGQANDHATGTARQSWLGLLSINFTSFVLMVSITGFRNSVVPVHGGVDVGLDVAMLGVLLTISGVLRFLITLVSGFASDRHGRKSVLIPGILFQIIGTLGFVWAGTEAIGYASSLLILSLGGFGNSVVSAMIVDVVPQAQIGRYISLNRFVGDLGMLVGPLGLGIIWDSAGFPAAAFVTVALLLATLPGLLFVEPHRENRYVAQDGSCRRGG